jgi:hypothetical protein
MICFENLVPPLISHRLVLFLVPGIVSLKTNISTLQEMASSFFSKFGLTYYLEGQQEGVHEI